MILVFALHSYLSSQSSDIYHFRCRNCRKYWLLMQLTSGGDERGVHYLRQLARGGQTGTEVRGSFQPSIWVLTEHEPPSIYEPFFHASIFFFIFFWSRTARSSMKPDPAEDSVFLPERSVKVGDEVAEGEYGLVINGHSLVCHKKFPNYNSYCDCPCWLVLLIT